MFLYKSIQSMPFYTFSKSRLVMVYFNNVFSSYQTKLSEVGCTSVLSWISPLLMITTSCLRIKIHDNIYDYENKRHIIQEEIKVWPQTRRKEK